MELGCWGQQWVEEHKSAWQAVGCRSAWVPVEVACMLASEGRACIVAGAWAGKQAWWA